MNMHSAPNLVRGADWESDKAKTESARFKEHNECSVPNRVWGADWEADKVKTNSPVKVKQGSKENWEDEKKIILCDKEDTTTELRPPKNNSIDLGLTSKKKLWSQQGLRCWLRSWQHQSQLTCESNIWTKRKFRRWKNWRISTVKWSTPTGNNRDYRSWVSSHTNLHCRRNERENDIPVLFDKEEKNLYIAKSGRE